jgi:hypothetical protein
LKRISDKGPSCGDSSIKPKREEREIGTSARTQTATGGGKTDIAVFRPSDGQLIWPVSLDGKKMESETDKILGIFNRPTDIAK